MIYLDHAASTPLSEKARLAMVEASQIYGNPNSSHDQGRLARAPVRDLKEEIASIFDTEAEFIFITSSGSAANQAVINHYKLDGYKCSGSFLGHSSNQDLNNPYVLRPNVFGPPREKNTIQSWATGVLDNLTGCFLASSVSPLTGDLLEMPKLSKGGVIHLDHVQGFGKVEPEYGWATLSISAHKIGGPRGIGAVVCSSIEFIEDLEEEEVQGTTSPELAAGFCAALRQMGEHSLANLIKVRTQFFKLLNDIPAAIEILTYIEETTSIILLAVPRPKKAREGVNEAVLYLSQHKVCVSEGTACSSPGDPQLQMIRDFYGLKKEDLVRVSLDYTTSSKDIKTFISTLTKYLL